MITHIYATSTQALVPDDIFVTLLSIPALGLTCFAKMATNHVQPEDMAFLTDLALYLRIDTHQPPEEIIQLALDRHHELRRESDEHLSNFVRNRERHTRQISTLEQLIYRAENGNNPPGDHLDDAESEADSDPSPGTTDMLDIGADLSSRELMEELAGDRRNMGSSRDAPRARERPPVTPRPPTPPVPRSSTPLPERASPVTVRPSQHRRNRHSSPAVAHSPPASQAGPFIQHLARLLNTDPREILVIGMWWRKQCETGDKKS